jgi:uncharacterized membrane protein YphA (DoxX/SURF4 family)
MANSGRGRTVGLWALRGSLAAAFLAAGGAKLAGVPAMVEMFERVGVGHWFRIVTGLLEVTGGILLLIPRVTLRSCLASDGYGWRGYGTPDRPRWQSGPRPASPRF